MSRLRSSDGNATKRAHTRAAKRKWSKYERHVLYGVPRLESVERLWIDGIEITPQFYDTIAERERLNFEVPTGLLTGPTEPTYGISLCRKP